MAKGAIFWNNATGKIGNLVLSVRKGQQITRQYQPNVANPKTFAQTEQRIKFSNAGKFFKRAISNFFIGAFEGNEKLSPWNAFMKYNATNAALVMRDQYKENNYPALGRFVMSVGSLGSLNYEISEDYYGAGGLSLGVSGLSSSDNTIGKVSAKILAANPQLLNGDTITFVMIVSRLTSISGEPTEAPSWTIAQFVLDSNNTANIPNEFVVGDDGDGNYALSYKIPGYQDTYTMGGAVIVARKTETGIKATNSTLALGGNASSIINASSTGAYPTQAALSWGAVASDAVLV